MCSTWLAIVGNTDRSRLRPHTADPTAPSVLPTTEDCVPTSSGAAPKRSETARSYPRISASPSPAQPSAKLCASPRDLQCLSLDPLALASTTTSDYNDHSTTSRWSLGLQPHQPRQQKRSITPAKVAHHSGSLSRTCFSPPSLSIAFLSALAPLIHRRDRRWRFVIQQPVLQLAGEHRTLLNYTSSPDPQTAPADPLISQCRLDSSIRYSLRSHFPGNPRCTVPKGRFMVARLPATKALGPALFHITGCQHQCKPPHTRSRSTAT